jgi:TonB family protein
MMRRNVLKSMFFSGTYLFERLLSSGASGAEASHEPILRRFLVPSYPPLLRQAGSEGKVSVTIGVGEQGTVESLKDFSGPKLFYDEVEKCLRTWRFEPSNTGPTELTIIFQFALRGARDERCLHYQVSGELPSSFLIEVNPFLNVNS